LVDSERNCKEKSPRRRPIDIGALGNTSNNNRRRVEAGFARRALHPRPSRRGFPRYEENADKTIGQAAVGRGDTFSIDIELPYGTPVRATADGELSGAAIGAGYGRAVVLNYGHDVMRAYGHLSAIAVVAGQTGRARPIPVCTSRRKCIMSVNSNRYLRTAYAQATNWQGIRAVAERQPHFDPSE
jgi:hypothetical protein